MPRVVAETPDLLAIDKPAGLITHRDGRTEEPSLAEWIAEHFPTMTSVGEPWISPQGERVRVCGLVHRLDRTTSGIIVAAKHDAAFAMLKQAFKERRVEKRYRALVYGHVPKDHGVIVAEIARTGVAPKRWCAKPSRAHDKRAAITHWRLLSRLTSPEGEQVSYLELEPKTGRTHQLRVHLASIGHPIVADHLYAEGKGPLAGITRPALHALEIAFEIDGRRYAFSAPLAEDMASAIGR